MKTSNNNLAFVGSYSTVQSGPIEYISKNVALSLNSRQAELYSRLLKGLSYYPKESLYAMNSKKKSKIVHLHKRAQHEINLFKQQILIVRTNAILPKLNEILEEYMHEGTKTSAVKARILPNDVPKVFTTGLFQQLLSLETQVDNYFKCTLTFKELGIKKEDVVNLLIAKRLLPNNFFEIE